jgi:hypothetical protein
LTALTIRTRSVLYEDAGQAARADADADAASNRATDRLA